MAALGMRHVLPLTGDPARVGDHPGAASVYDVNSVQLIAIAKRMNEGFNHAGKSLSSATQFVVGCTLNANSKNIAAQNLETRAEDRGRSAVCDDTTGL